MNQHPSCDSHYEEVPATRTIHYRVLPGTVEEHGSTIDICDSDACETKARALVAEYGDVIEIVPLAVAA